MKRFVAPVGIVLAALTVASTQMAIHPGRRAGPADIMGGTIGDLVGSTVGDRYGQTLVTCAGALLGGRTVKKTDRFELHLAC